MATASILGNAVILPVSACYALAVREVWDLKMFFHRSLLLGVSTFAVVPLLVLAASPPWEIGRRHGELFVAGSADDASLRTRIAALSPTVSPDEDRRVAYAAYMTGLELRREWRVV